MNTISSEGIRRFASISPRGDLWWRLPARPGGAGGCRPDPGIVVRIGAQVSSSGKEIISHPRSCCSYSISCEGLTWRLRLVRSSSSSGTSTSTLRRRQRRSASSCSTSSPGRSSPCAGPPSTAPPHSPTSSCSSTHSRMYYVTICVRQQCPPQKGPPRHPAGAARYRGCRVRGLQEAGGGPGPGGGGDTWLPRTPGLQEPRGETCLRLQCHAGPKGDNLETLAIGLQTGRNYFTNIITPRKWHCIISVAVYVAMFIIQFWLFIITFIFSLF